MPRLDRVASSVTNRILDQHARKHAERWEWASKEQEEIFLYPPFPIVASGGFGSGKTIGFCRKALWIMSEFPNSRGVIIRKTWEHLEQTTMKTFFKVCPPPAYLPYGRRSDQGKELVLNNQSSLVWMHLNHPQSLTVLRGLEINWFLIDQAEEIEEEVFDILMGRLGRWDHAEVPEYRLRRQRAKTGKPWPWRHPVTNKPVPPGYALMTVNPEHELHWVYRRFHPDSPEIDVDRQAEDGTLIPSYRSQGYKMVTMDSRDNRFLDPTNLRRLLNHDTAYVNKFVKGIWGNPAGTIHVVPREVEVQGTPELIDWLVRHCKLHMTLDHGDSAPTCVIWWAEDADGNLWAYREYYKAASLISAHRDAVWQLAGFDRERGATYSTKLADPSIFAPIQQKGGKRWSIAAEWADRRELERATAIDWQPAVNDELTTRNRINELLAPRVGHVHPITKEGPAPHLYIVTSGKDYPFGCVKLLTELRSQKREKTGTVDGKDIFSDDRDDTIPDHAYDNLRYRVSVPLRAAVLEGERAKAGSFVEVWGRLQTRLTSEGVLARTTRLPAGLQHPGQSAPTAGVVLGGKQRQIVRKPT